MLSWTLAGNMLYSDPPWVNCLLDLLKDVNLVQTELDDGERVVSNKRFDSTSTKAFHYFLLIEKVSIVIEFFEWFPHWAGFLVRLMLAFIRSKQPGIKIHHELSQPLGHCWEFTKVEAWLHSPNVTLGSVLAVKKWDIGISPKVMYRLYLGLIQMWRKEGLGISPNVLYR